MDAAGDFVIAWQEADGSDFGIHAQKFVAANGFAGNGEFIANTVTADKQIFPSVAMDAAGDFVIAWQDFGHDGSGYGVYARRFNAAGVAQGAETLVNQTTINWQISPEVSMDAATGDYAVSWTTFGEPGASTVYSVYARTFSASGAATSSEFRVNANTLINSGYMDITALTSCFKLRIPRQPQPGGARHRHGRLRQLRRGLGRMEQRRQYEHLPTQDGGEFDAVQPGCTVRQCVVEQLVDQRVEHVVEQRLNDDDHHHQSADDHDAANHDAANHHAANHHAADCDDDHQHQTAGHHTEAADYDDYCRTEAADRPDDHHAETADHHDDDYHHKAADHHADHHHRAADHHHRAADHHHKADDAHDADSPEAADEQQHNGEDFDAAEAPNDHRRKSGGRGQHVDSLIDHFSRDKQRRALRCRSGPKVVGGLGDLDRPRCLRHRTRPV